MAKLFSVISRELAIEAGFKPTSNSDFNKFAVVSLRTETGKIDHVHAWTFKEESANAFAAKRNEGNQKIQEMFKKTMIMIDRLEAKGDVEERQNGIDADQAKARKDAKKEIENDIRKGVATYL